MEPPATSLWFTKYWHGTPASAQIEAKTAAESASVFDNEETGSGTKQGAGSPVLEFILRRISSALGANEEDYMRLEREIVVDYFILVDVEFVRYGSAHESFYMQR